MNAYAGVIEGFYGIPLWDRESRLSYPSWLRDHGFSFYIYAPKNDVFLRKQWSDDWPESEMRLFDTEKSPKPTTISNIIPYLYKTLS